MASLVCSGASAATLEATVHDATGKPLADAAVYAVPEIDRAFVSDMEADARNAAIVHSTIELGHNLGFTVVTEGVETEHALAAASGLRHSPR